MFNTLHVHVQTSTVQGRWLVWLHHYTLYMCRYQLGVQYTGLPLQLLHEEPAETAETRGPRQELQVSIILLW